MSLMSLVSFLRLDQLIKAHIESVPTPKPSKNDTKLIRSFQEILIRFGSAWKITRYTLGPPTLLKNADKP
jgi:hypothetical protein